jgi:hypothetical protein
MTDDTIRGRYRGDRIVIRRGLNGDVWLRTLEESDDVEDGRMVCLTEHDVADLVLALQDATAPSRNTDDGPDDSRECDVEIRAEMAREFQRDHDRGIG